MMHNTLIWWGGGSEDTGGGASGRCDFSYYSCVSPQKAKYMWLNNNVRVACFKMHANRKRVFEKTFHHLKGRECTDAHRSGPLFMYSQISLIRGL